jgi:2-iminobutanoate/2-iminopropanoate deaminase
MRKAITAAKGARPAGQYSHAIVANGFVFVSGQGPVNPKTGKMPADLAGQVRQTLKNVRTILRAAGADMKDVVKVNSYLVDLTRFEEYNNVYKEFFKHEPPARTTVATGLKGILVEIDCIAVLPNK